ncbi:bifunctional methylenetetrahydrofolate dehydrogenase/methenyltetrahydrofolate cyclohydrolase [Actinomycetaceae bacterium TAE3-ERU4]|nr:bifunctional methylenetetrahydrofolate dehydrogenase/methenyltetrahydrofolate cyclohydrolase [Actinomycetaceae bacterium TAE3-ERU4]
MRAPWMGRAIVLDGKACAQEIKNNLALEVAKLKRQGKIPGLGTILVGKDPGSVAYVNGKHQDCAEVGINSIREDLPADASEDEVLAAVERLNQNPDCSAYIVQLPLPAHMDTNRILNAIDPLKDADGLHPQNLGKLVLETAGNWDFPLPCTPRACLELLQYGGISLNGKNVVVIGRGVTVGRSFGLLAGAKAINATVTTCHTGTKNLTDHTRQADIIIAASGVAGILKPGMIKTNAVVLDVGVSRVELENGKARLEGDVANGVDEVASYLSPNPGGVGPMTRAMLLKNVVEIAGRTAVKEKLDWKNGTANYHL